MIIVDAIIIYVAISLGVGLNRIMFLMQIDAYNQTIPQGDTQYIKHVKFTTILTIIFFPSYILKLIFVNKN